MVLADGSQYFYIADHDRVCLVMNWRAEKAVVGKTELANNVRCSFLVYPSAFSQDPALKVDQSVTSIVAIILLALGFTVSVTLWFICTSWLFQLDVIFLCVSPYPIFIRVGKSGELT